MNIKKVFLLITLVLLIIGVSYASEVSNETTITDSETSIAQDTSSNADTVDTIVKEETNENKEIIKDVNNNRTVKTASKSYDITNYDSLSKALTAETYGTVTVNIKSNIKLADNILLNSAIKTLTINGNKKTIDGNNQYQFLTITSSNNVIIKNLKIIHCHAEDYGGAIFNNNGNLTIINSTLNNNKANYDGGGALYNRGTTTIINSNLNNNSAYCGGAIYDTGILNINNSKLNNNLAEYNGGAIHNSGTLTMTNSTLNNNQAEYHGGAIYSNGNLTITKTTLNNNTGYVGGAIFNEGILTITDSILNNNTADTGGSIYNNRLLTIIKTTLNNNQARGYDGGAIQNWGILIIKNCKLNNNYADNAGGAIRNCGTLTLNQSTLNNDTADYCGGVLYDTGNSYLYNNTINNNKANYDGGAICAYPKNLTIIKCIFSNNTAVHNGGSIYANYFVLIDSTLNYNSVGYDGGALCYWYDCNITVINCTIYHNHANNTGGAIRNGGNFTLINSRLFNNTADYYGDNFNDWGNLTQINVSFDDPREATLFKYTYLGNVKLGTTVKIVGRLVSNVTGTPIKYTEVSLKINNKTYELKTDASGYIRMNYTVNNYDDQKISFLYDGNSVYSPCNNSTTFKVKQPTWIKIAYMSNVKYGDTVNVVGRLLYNSTTPLKYKSVYVTVNDKEYQITTDGAGYIRLNYIVKNYDTQKISFKYKGSTTHLSSTNNTTFHVKQPTWIKIAYMSNVKYGSTVNVVGRILYNGTTPLKYKSVYVTVNDKEYQVTTDGAGYIRLNYTVKNYDTQKITFKYKGSTTHLSCTNSTTFQVKQPTWIKIAYMSNVKYGSTVNVVGRLLYNGTTPIKFKQVIVTVNNKDYETTTDGAGYIRLNYTVDSYDIQKITFKFKGSTTHLSSTNSTTFKVKQPTVIKYTSISALKVGSVAKIVGRVLYNGTNAVKNVPVKVTVNSDVYEVVTDASGYFRLNYTVTSAGVVTISSRFAGTTLYISSTNTIKFTAVKA